MDMPAPFMDGVGVFDFGLLYAKTPQKRKNILIADLKEKLIYSSLLLTSYGK